MSATPWLTHTAKLEVVLREGANVSKDRLVRERRCGNSRCPKGLPDVKADEIQSYGETRLILDLYRGAKASASYPHLELCQVPVRGLVRISTTEEICP